MLNNMSHTAGRSVLQSVASSVFDGEVFTVTAWNKPSELFYKIVESLGTSPGLFLDNSRQITLRRTHVPFPVKLPKDALPS